MAMARRRRRLPVCHLALLLVASFLGGEQCHHLPPASTETCPSTRQDDETPNQHYQCRAMAVVGIGAVAAEALRRPPPDPVPSNRQQDARNSTTTGSLSGNAAAVKDDCHCDAVDSKTNGLPVRIAYLVVVHNQRTMDDAVHLIRAIRHPQHHLVIHVDIKAQELVNASSLRAELDKCRQCFATQRMEAVYDVKWSHWSMNLPTLWGMEQLLHESDSWDVFINLSGDTMPVFKPRPLAERLAAFRYNFVTSSSCATGLTPTNVYEFPSFWHKRAHYTINDSEPDPVFEHDVLVDDKSLNGTTTSASRRQSTVVTHFGSQWMILQRSFVSWLVSELSRPDSLASQYRDYLAESGKLMTDETYVPSLVVSQFPETLPQTDAQGFLVPFPPPIEHGSEISQESYQITDVRYERMDENVPTAFGELWTDQRYVVPNRTHPVGEKDAEAIVEPVRPWGPYFLGVYDLGNVRGSGALFVRKVSSAMDDNMVRLLPVERTDDIPDIRWPKHEIALLEKPDWSKKIEEWKRRAAEKQRAARDATLDPADEEEDEEL